MPLLRSTGSGFQGVNDYVGPDVERCLFEGMSDDGFDLRGSLATIVGVANNTVSVSPGQSWPWSASSTAPGNRIRLSDDHGACQDALVTGIASNVPERDGNGNLVLDSHGNPIYVDVLTLNTSVHVHAGTINNISYNARASNPGHNCAGYQIIDTTVRDNRARGALVRGDNGLIQNCAFTNISMQAVLIGLEWEYKWDEGDYSQNVVIQDNTMTNVGWVSNQTIYVGGAGFGGGIGALYNKNITIRDNTFIGDWGTNILASDVDGLNVSWNTFANPYQNAAGGAGPLIDLELANNTTLTSNLVTATGPYMNALVYQGDRVTNLYNNNSTGIQKGMPSSGVYKISPSTNPALSLSAANTGNVTPLLQSTSTGGIDQQWVVTQRSGASTTVQRVQTNQIIDDSGAKTTTNPLATYSYNPAASWSQWQFSDVGGGFFNIKNTYSQEVMNVPSSNQASGIQIQQYANDGSSACQWLLTLLAATPGPNLLTNGSFEGGLYGWTASGPIYTEGGFAQDAGLLMTIYQTSPYQANIRRR